MREVPESYFIDTPDDIDINTCLICNERDITWSSVPYHLVNKHYIFYTPITTDQGFSMDMVFHRQRVIR